MQSRYTVNGVGTVDRHPGHLYLTIGKDGQTVNKLGIHTHLEELSTLLVVDALDDLEDSREQEAEDIAVPLLQSLSHDGVVGVSKCMTNDLPCIFPLHAVLINEDTHELRNTDNRVCIVKLDAVELGKLTEIVAINSLVVSYDILQGCGYEEVLLTYTEYFTVVRCIIRIKHTEDIVYAVSLDNSVIKTLGVKEIEVEFLSRLALPKAQTVYVMCSITCDRHVARDRPYVKVIKVYADLILISRDNERITILHPGIRMFSLEAVLECLTEQTITVKDTVTCHREIQSCTGIKEAGCQTAETAVTERCIGFFFEKICQVNAEALHSLNSLLVDTEVYEVIQHGTANQELSGEVMGLTDLSVLLTCLLPVVRHDLNDGTGKCKPVVSCGTLVRTLTGAGLDLECHHIVEFLSGDIMDIRLRINCNLSAIRSFYSSSLLCRCFFSSRSLLHCRSSFLSGCSGLLSRSSLLYCSCSFLSRSGFLGRSLRCRSGCLCSSCFLRRRLCRSCCLLCRCFFSGRSSLLCCCCFLYCLLCFFLLCTFTHNDAPPFPHRFV